MRKVQVVMPSRKQIIADRCQLAESFGSRLVGLMGRKVFEDGEGLWFPRCNNIHMWFMRIPIDVVFVRALAGTHGRYTVTSLRSRVRPWRVLPIADFRADDTLELPVGTIERTQLSQGDELCFA